MEVAKAASKTWTKGVISRPWHPTILLQESKRLKRSAKHGHSHPSLPLMSGKLHASMELFLLWSLLFKLLSPSVDIEFTRTKPSYLRNAIVITWPDRIFLLACVTSLEGQTVINLIADATSAFAQHSLISTVYVVQGVVYGEYTEPGLPQLMNETPW